MSHRRVNRILIGLAVLAVGLFGASAVFAQTGADISPEKLSVIVQHCSSSQFALQQIEKRDAVSRINRGRDYDQMLRQVSAMNSRFAYNKISAPDMLQITSDMQSHIDKFRANYDKYDTDLTNAAAIDCKSKPADYYDVVTHARDDRNAVGDEVQTINDLTNQYRSALVKYKDTVQ